MTDSRSAGAGNADRGSPVEVFLFATNAGGEAELLRVRVLATPEEVGNNLHCERAIEWAQAQEYEDVRAFDRIDPAGRLMTRLLEAEALVLDVASTPLQGEDCEDAPEGKQSWVDQEHVGGVFFSFVAKARSAVQAETREAVMGLRTAHRGCVAAVGTSQSDKPESPRG